MSVDKAIKSHNEKMKGIKLPNKTADEMFEESGFLKHEGYHTISYNHWNNNEINTEIIFHKFHKEYEFENLDIAIDTKLHSAIHQKLIELGWFDMSE